MRAVVDTNILVSALISPAGVGAQLLETWEKGRFTLVTSHGLLQELAEVLGRPRLRALHKRTDAQLQDVLTGFAQFGEVVEASEELQVVEGDPDDDLLFEAAVAGSAGYILTWDEAVLAVREYRGIQVLPPEGFLSLLARSGKAWSSGS